MDRMVIPYTEMFVTEKSFNKTIMFSLCMKQINQVNAFDKILLKNLHLQKNRYRMHIIQTDGRTE